MSRLENTLVFFGVMITTLLVFSQTVKDSFYTQYPCFDGGKGICSIYYAPKTAFWDACIEDIKYQCEEGEEEPPSDDEGIPGC